MEQKAPTWDPAYVCFSRFTEQRGTPEEITSPAISCTFDPSWSLLPRARLLLTRLQIQSGEDFPPCKALC